MGEITVHNNRNVSTLTTVHYHELPLTKYGPLIYTDEAKRSQWYSCYCSAGCDSGAAPVEGVAAAACLARGPWDGAEGREEGPQS